MNDFVRWVKEVEFLIKRRSSVTNKDQEDNKKLLHRERSGERDRERERERRAHLSITERESGTGECARSILPRPRANIPKYGREQVKLLRSLLYGILLRTKRHFR